ncbi:MAG: DUF2007 domain-containing protein [Pseudomonadota bacterium]|nr:DUF2007 domain-containing protein [Pseudomonadota bacterium]
MRELLRGTELVFLSWVEALLKSEGIEPIMLDIHTSVLEGSTWAIPRRMMVHDEDFHRARRLVSDSGNGASLSPE